VSKPYISIIIPSHNRNRKRYLLEAVKSALNQDLFHDLYEIIVVKYYNEKDLDKQLEEWGVKNIFSQEESLGGKIFEGLQIAEGEIISFLEDDDMFCSNKLQTVYNVFQDNDIIFLRDRCFIINSYGKVIGVERLSKRLELSTFNRNQMRKLISFNLMTNISAMSIRGSLLRSVNVEFLRRLWFTLDVLFPLLSLKQGGKLIFDCKPLTLYRIHNDHSSFDLHSFEKYVKRRCLTANKFSKSYKNILELFRDTPYERLIKPYLIRSNMVCLVFCSLLDKEYACTKVNIQDLFFLFVHPNISYLRPLDLIFLYALSLSSKMPRLIKLLAAKMEYNLLLINYKLRSMI